MTARTGLPQVNSELRAGVTLLESKKTARYSSRPPARDAAHNAKQKPTKRERIE